MATWRRDGRLTGGQRLLCAGLAGTLSLSLTAPLELATVLAQVGVVRGHARGPWATGHRVWRAEGLRALWKGNAVACLRLFPCSAVQLAAYRKFVVLFTDDLGHISQWSSIMAGSLAGMVSTIVTYPTDLIKTRLIMQNILEPSYRGLLHAFSTIYQQEGFLALYRGVSLTVVGSEPLPPTQWRSRCPFLRSSGLLPADSEGPGGPGALEWIDSQFTEDSSIFWNYV
uniref:cDNA FLJ58871 n=1 Tax=Homo sapiens TaxID=9606 RepID=B4E1P8_HUMAN|nr:unnamed protein product [Homo sapiens]